MKLSVGNPFDKDAEVYLNGDLVANCISADEEAGKVEYFPVDENGNPVTCNGDIERVTAEGIVEIRFPPGIRAMAEYLNADNGDPLGILPL